MARRGSNTDDVIVISSDEEQREGVPRGRVRGSSRSHPPTRGPSLRYDGNSPSPWCVFGRKTRGCCMAAGRGTATSKLDYPTTGPEASHSPSGDTTTTTAGMKQAIVPALGVIPQGESQTSQAVAATVGLVTWRNGDDRCQKTVKQ
ncbi:GH23588 [Drosophila grimshawi]|uniref:GH23588 n=1 Tax=Drosophila grimshawi TaxID=7222 RepID=B4K0V1_DROGR|nr:GH23588 [Drosophila grimshawi]